MKIRSIIFTISMCMLFVSCMKEEAGDFNIHKTDNIFSFKISVHDEQIVTTRNEAIQTGMINNMSVLVFDQNGHFLSRAVASVSSTNPGNYTVRLAPTDQEWAQEKRKRTVHFICNYDWSDFNDIANIGKHENEIIPQLSVTNGVIGYWQRVVLSNGITEGAFPATIVLQRNVAKISVIDNTNLSRSTGLTDPSFAIGDYAEYGTVAPFNTSTMLFDESSVTESPFGVLQTLQESDFVPAGVNQVIANSLLCYERKNSIAPAPLYVIIKGKYGTDTDYTYYKIDIVPDGQEVLYDIQRNCHYILDIRTITDAGYATLQEAMSSPASNNLLYSVLLAEYTSISGGNSILNIERTEKILVEAGQTFTLGYSYIPDITTGTENNTSVQFNIEQDAANPVLDESTIQIDRTAGSASYSAKTSALPTNEVYTARLIINATNNGVNLRRVVNLRLRQPSVFKNVSLSPATVPASVGANVDISFTIPSDIRASAYPMEIFITTTALSPNLAVGYDNDLSLDYQVPGKYRYRYVALGPGEHTIHFKTTFASTSDVMVLESELFSKVQINLNN